MQKRNIEALNEILQKYADKNIVIGTHGTALSSIFNYYDPGFNGESFMKIIDFMSYMEGCFSGCENLTQALVIPSGVTNMGRCFMSCERLTQAPVIPSGVLYMAHCFSRCINITAVTLKCNYNPGTIPGSWSLHNGAFEEVFYDCYKLETGSIKVPAAQLQTYKDNAWTMRAQKTWFIAE